MRSAAARARKVIRRPGGAVRYRLLDYTASISVVAGATVLGSMVRRAFALPDFVMLYLLAIGVVAGLFGRGPAVVATLLSGLAYSLFFAHQAYSFAGVHHYMVTSLMMFLTGGLLSELAIRLRRQEGEARRQADWTAKLYSLSRGLGAVSDVSDAAQATAEHAVRAFGGGAVMLTPDADGTLIPLAQRGARIDLAGSIMDDAVLTLRLGHPLDRGAERASGQDVLCLPLSSGGRTHGVLVLAAKGLMNGDRLLRDHIDGFTKVVTAALEHLRLEEEAKTATLKARTEEMRSSLLSTVSHDLRTPLSAITGAASALLERAKDEQDGFRRELLDTIYEEAVRLERLVGNLLYMTRLEAGAVAVQREWVLVEEVVGTALNRLESSVSERPVHADMPADLPLAWVDPVLLEQVLVNLVDNACKYSPPGTPVDIRARGEEDRIEIEVADRGPGFSPGTEEQVFEKFHRGQHQRIQGAGLGLAICRAIVEAHGGEISAQNRVGGGAVFRVSLPAVGNPPEVPIEDETKTATEGEDP